MKNKMLISIFLSVMSLTSHAFISSGNNAISVGSPPVSAPPVLPVAQPGVTTSPPISPVQDTTLAISDSAIAVAQPAHLAGGVKYDLMEVTAQPASQVNLSSGSSVASPCSDNSISCKIQIRRAAALAATGKNKTASQLDAMKNGTDSCSSGGAFVAYGSSSFSTFNGCLETLSASKATEVSGNVYSGPTTTMTTYEASATTATKSN